MNPKFTQEENQVIHEIYTGIAENKEIQIDQRQFMVISSILNRSKPEVKYKVDDGEVLEEVGEFPKNNDYTALDLTSIKMVFEQTLNNVPDEEKDAEIAGLLNSVIKKASRFVS
jgi:hypothetical protein